MTESDACRTHQHPCPSCDERVRQFAGLLCAYLDAATHDGSETSDRFFTAAAALYDAELIIPAWYHCAVYTVVLAGEPVTVDRDRAWPSLVNYRPAQVEQLYDVIDKVMLAAAADDRDEVNDLCKQILVNPDTEIHTLAHLTLTRLALQYLGQEMTIWQQAIHRAVLGDVWQAISRPHELLMASRISGSLAGKDSDRYQQLITRAARQEMMSALVTIWSHGSAVYLDQAKYAIVQFAGDVPDAILDPDAPFADEPNTQKGFILAERMVRATATNDFTIVSTIHAEIAKEPVLYTHMVHGLAYFHSQVMQALMGEAVRDVLQREHLEDTTVSGSGTPEDPWKLDDEQ